jgi:hypothetical protein
MTIQRKRYEITTHLNKKDSTEMAVQLVIYCDGTIGDRSDALLMIADAWRDAMKEAGFDPVKSMVSMETHGELQ